MLFYRLISACRSIKYENTWKIIERSLPVYLMNKTFGRPLWREWTLNDFHKCVFKLIIKFTCLYTIAIKCHNLGHYIKACVHITVTNFCLTAFFILCFIQVYQNEINRINNKKGVFIWSFSKIYVFEFKGLTTFKWLPHCRKILSFKHAHILRILLNILDW